MAGVGLYDMRVTADLDLGLRCRAFGMAPRDWEKDGERAPR